MSDGTDILKKNKIFIESHRDKTRGLLRSTDFVNCVGHSLLLTGWSVESIMNYFASGGKRPIELISIGQNKAEEHIQGEIVSRKTVFASSEGVLIEDDKISFLTPEGLYININQYDYIQEHGGLNANQLFASAVKKDSDVEASFKFLSRKEAQTRRDRNINVLYLAGPVIQWDMEDTKIRNKYNVVNSPLFYVSVKSDAASKGRPKVVLLGGRVQVNATLARIIKTQLKLDLFDGVPTEFAFADYKRYIDVVKTNLTEYPEIKLHENNLYLCLLDSTNELICQAVDRRMNEIVNSDITSVLSGAKSYERKYHEGLNLPAIYPLPADDSQREVIRYALAGDSINCHAGPGTGKSQTVVNVAINLLMQGKRVCITSEKAAANEVVRDYLARCGLDKYCLYLDKKVSVKGVISQIKRSLALAEEYVDTEAALAVIAAYHEVCDEFEKLNRIYEDIPELNTTIYNLIGEAMSSVDLASSDYVNVLPFNYKRLHRKISEFQTQYLDTISDGEWNDYLTLKTTGDEEIDELLTQIISEIELCGIKFISLINDKHIAKHNVALSVNSQLARYFAQIYIQRYNLSAYGNRKLKMLNKKLVETSAALQNVSAQFARQELGRMIREASKGSKFVELLDRLAQSRISLNDFFNRYGSEILKFCPIIIGTPYILAAHDSLNSFDAVICDECSQFPATSVFPLLAANRQLIIFGDPMQLDLTSFFTRGGIYAAGEGENFDLSESDKSVLHVAQGKLPGCQLQFHYRSKTEHLIAVSNKFCYEGLLNVAPDYYFGRENLPDDLGLELVELSDPEISQYGANLSEVKTIVDRVIDVRRRYPNKVVGIITFNDTQQTAINDEIDKRIDDDPNLAELLNLDGEELFLRTLEAAQGKEADTIFISIGHYRRNTDGAIAKQISNLNTAGAVNRLNVLFTRAREKVVVVVSFSYKELRNTQDKEGIYRLYEYLRYMDGDTYAVSNSSSKKLVDRYNKTLVEMLKSCLGEYDVYGKVGSASMTVDVGLIKPGEQHYNCGIIFPDKALTPNTICTKVNVLERTGWCIIPLSPITCFTKPEVFTEQLQKDLSENLHYSQPGNQVFSVNVKPSRLLMLEDFAVQSSEPVSADEQLAGCDFMSAYADVWHSNVASAEGKQLIKLVKSGNSQAKLKLYIMNMPQFIAEGRLNDLLDKVKDLYLAEHLTSYLYARLLCWKGDPADKSLEDMLFAEAKVLGIKVA